MADARDTPAPHVRPPTGTEDPARVVPAFSWFLLSALVLASLIALIVLDRAGTASRAVPDRPAVVVVDDSHALLATWQSDGIHGAALVDVTNDTGFSVPAPADPSEHRLAGWPVPLTDPSDLFIGGVERRSVIRVAAMTGIVRSISYVFEPDDLADKVADGRTRGLRGISADGRSVTANDDGYLRWLRARFPEPAPKDAILNIDASYFVRGTPEGLLEQMQGSAGTYGLITLDRATDATALPEVARTRLDRMADILREGVGR